AAPRSPRLRPQAAGSGGGAQGHRLRRLASPHPQRQDHAAPAARSRTRAPRGRPLHPGGHVPMTAAPAGPIPAPVPSPVADAEHARHLLQEMLRIRRFEERCADLYKAEKIRGFLHLYIGEEAVAVGVMQALDAEDAIVATYREHGHALVRGVSARSIMAEMFGKAEGCSGGRGGSMHLFDAATR